MSVTTISMNDVPGLPRGIDPKTAPMPTGATASQETVARKIKTKTNRVLGWAMKGNVLHVTLIPRYEAIDERPEQRGGRVFIREIDPDGSWYQEGLRYRKGTDKVYRGVKVIRKFRSDSVPEDVKAAKAKAKAKEAKAKAKEKSKAK